MYLYRPLFKETWYIEVHVYIKSIWVNEEHELNNLPAHQAKDQCWNIIVKPTNKDCKVVMLSKQEYILLRKPTYS